MDSLSIDNAVLLPEIKSGWTFKHDSSPPCLDRVATQERYELNEITAMIVGYCDGINSVAKIIEVLCARFPDAAEDIPVDVENVLRDLHHGDALTFSPKQHQLDFEPPEKSPPHSETRKLCVGMATYDDYDGVYFSIQGIRLFHPEITDDVEFVVIDNHPTGPCADALKKLESWVPNYRYVPCESIRGTAVRDILFREANAEYVLCIDSHVLIEAGAIEKLLDYFSENPGTPDLLQGPLINDDMRNISTHFIPDWRDGMYGTWGCDERALVEDATAFDIPMQGLGLFACAKSAWPGFNPRFSGFGGEEGYIHEKFRQAGGQTLCLPFLRWLHRFVRPMGTRYEVNWKDRIRNYLIGREELGLGTEDLVEHFTSYIGERGAASIIQDVVQEMENPFFYFEAIYCIVDDDDFAQTIALQSALAEYGILHRVKQLSATGLAEEADRKSALAHQRIVEEARDNGFHNVLVFEQGRPLPAAPNASLKEEIEALKRSAWQLFTLDDSGNTISDFDHVNIQKLLNSPSLGAIGYHSEIYDRLLEEFENLPKQI